MSSFIMLTIFFTNLKYSQIDLYYQTMETLRMTLENMISKYTYAFPTNGKTLFEGMTLSGAVSLYEVAYDVTCDNNLRAKRVNFKDHLISNLQVYPPHFLFILFFEYYLLSFSYLSTN